MYDKHMVDLINNLSAAVLETSCYLFQEFPSTKKKSDSFPQWSCILSVLENYQIRSDISHSFQIFSESQSCFRRDLDLIKVFFS